MLQNKSWQNKISKGNALKVSVLKKKTGRINLRPNFLKEMFHPLCPMVKNLQICD
jgi:hypothetical protein